MSFPQNTLREGRIQESLGSLIKPIEENQGPKLETVLLISPDDQGVIRNLGRSGARFAPEAILAQLRKQTLCPAIKPLYLKNIICKNTEFDSMQSDSISTISKVLDSSPQKLIHLGGGHDHVFPLLKALDQKYKKIHILNIDAHLDTRQDQHNHSGTPFRQFINEAKGDYKILQTGIHHFANSKNTQADLGEKMQVQYFDSLAKETKTFTEIGPTLENFIKSPCDFFVLSLDADAVEASAMEAVSAVNGLGIPMSFINRITELVRKKSGPKAFGIYEYNPLFDNLSCKGARSLAAMIYQFIS